MLRSSTSRKSAGFGGLLATALLVLGVFAPSAFAHHPEIRGVAACDSSIAFTSEAWSTNDPDQRANGKIGISYSVDGGAYIDLPAKADYRYDAGNDYQFADTFSPAAGWSSVRLKATALAAWDSGAAPGSSTTSSPIAAKTDCGPVVPPAAPSSSIARATCSNEGADVTLTNTGGAPVDFTVDDGTDQRVVTVAGGDEREITVDIDEGDDVTITVTADGMETVTRTVSYDCDEPAEPSAAIASAECANTGAVVHLENTGGESVDFTIEVDGQDDIETTVDAGDDADVAVPTPADISTTITVRAPGMDDVTSEAIYTCAVPESEADAAAAAAAAAEAEAAEAAAAAEAAQVAGQLPATGSGTDLMVVLALTSVGAGVAMVGASRIATRRTHAAR